MLTFLYNAIPSSSVFIGALKNFLLLCHIPLEDGFGCPQHFTAVLSMLAVLAMLLLVITLVEEIG
jgi:hypothetical protein